MEQLSYWLTMKVGGDLDVTASSPHDLYYPDSGWAENARMAAPKSEIFWLHFEQQAGVESCCPSSDYI